MSIKEYHSYTFIVDGMGIIVESSDKLGAITKFSEEYRYLFNKQWMIVQNTISHKIDGIEEKYL